jgi:hypothetical protein
MAIRTKQRMIGLETFKFYYLFEAYIRVQEEINVCKETDLMISDLLDMNINSLYRDKKGLEEALATVAQKLFSLMEEQ